MAELLFTDNKGIAITSVQMASGTKIILTQRFTALEVQKLKEAARQGGIIILDRGTQVIGVVDKDNEVTSPQNIGANKTMDDEQREQPETTGEESQQPEQQQQEESTTVEGGNPEDPNATAANDAEAPAETEQPSTDPPVTTPQE